jgi:hypothetical protein
MGGKRVSEGIIDIPVRWTVWLRDYCVTGPDPPHYLDNASTVGQLVCIALRV